MGMSSDPTARKRSERQLTGPKTPEGRERSNQNLRPGRTRHGAYSEAMTRPLEDEHRAQKREQYPSAAATPVGNDLINGIAERRALEDRFAAFLADVGPIHLHRGRAEVQAAARELRLLIDADERAILQLAEIDRQAGGGAGVPSLEQIRDEYARGVRRLPPPDEGDEA
jgi:hypothetical protein